MAKKTFRTVYWNDDLENRVIELAEKEDSSVSRLVRRAMEQLLNTETVGSENRSRNTNESLSTDLC